MIRLVVWNLSFDTSHFSHYSLHLFATHKHDTWLEWTWNQQPSRNCHGHHAAPILALQLPTRSPWAADAERSKFAKIQLETEAVVNWLLDDIHWYSTHFTSQVTLFVPILLIVASFWVSSLLTVETQPFRLSTDNWWTSCWWDDSNDSLSQSRLQQVIGFLK